MEDFALRREQILLGLGALILTGFSAAAVFGSIHSVEVAGICLTVAAGLLGGPTIMRWDERRSKRR